MISRQHRGGRCSLRNYIHAKGRNRQEMRLPASERRRAFPFHSAACAALFDCIGVANYRFDLGPHVPGRADEFPFAPSSI